jgi:hypothetical protein
MALLTLALVTTALFSMTFPEQKNHTAMGDRDARQRRV